VVGFLGPNGAGKSTTMRMVTQYFEPVLWGAVALASRRSEGKSEPANLIPPIDTSTVDTIAITRPGDSAILVKSRGGAGSWRANGFPADAQLITELLTALADTSASGELVARNPASYERLRVSTDSGRRVRVISRAKTAVDIIAGKQTTDFGGIYLRRTGEPDVYAVRGNLATALGRQSDEWRNHTVAAIAPDSVTTIDIRRGNRSYTLRRKGSGWIFASGASADSGAVSGLLTSYRNLKATSFSTKAQEDSLRKARPRRTARLRDLHGRPILSLTFDSIASGIWVRHDSGGTAYRLDSWTADQLTPADSIFRKPAR
jgi:uncharacterized protein DUF4340